MAGAWTADLAQFAESAVSLSDPDALTAAFRSFIHARGMNGFACGEVDLRDLRRTVMVAAEWPKDWLDIYVAEGLVEADPAISVLGRSAQVMSWGAVDEAIGRFGAVRRAMSVAEDFGWRDGVFIPIPRGGSRWGLATVTGLEDPMSPEERSSLSIALLLYYERLRSLAAGRAPAVSFVGLTMRELDCLALVARGADDQTVGERLGIATATAHFHIEKAKRRLNVRTRTEAVAIAVSLGLISL